MLNCGSVPFLLNGVVFIRAIIINLGLKLWISLEFLRQRNFDPGSEQSRL